MSSNSNDQKANSYFDIWQQTKKPLYLFRAVKLEPNFLYIEEAKQEIQNWMNIAIYGDQSERKSGIKHMRSLCDLLYKMEQEGGKKGKFARKYLRMHISPALLVVLNRKRKGPVPKGFFDPPDIIKLALWKTFSFETEKILRRLYSNDEIKQDQKAKDLLKLFENLGIPTDRWLIKQCLPLERNDIARYLTAHKLDMSLNTFDKKYLPRLNKLYFTLVKE